MVEDLAPLGGDQHGARVALIDDLLKRLGLDRLQEPQPGAEPGEQHHGDGGEHAKPSCSPVRRHCYSVVTAVSGAAALTAAFTLVQSVFFTLTHHRPRGTKIGLASIAAAVTTATTVYQRSDHGCSSPTNVRTTGTSVSPTAVPSRRTAPTATIAGRS